MLQTGHHGSQHLVRCKNPKTIYATSPDTKQHCLVIPLEAPQGKFDQHVKRLMQDPMGGKE